MQDSEIAKLIREMDIEVSVIPCMRGLNYDPGTTRGVVIVHANLQLDDETNVRKCERCGAEW